MTPAQMVREFHEAFGVEIRDTPGIPANEVEVLRYDLIREEYLELMEALASGDVVRIAKESSDLMYVLLSTDLVYGIDSDRVFAAVHRSNMSKLGLDGRPVWREDGKVLKGPNYREPDIAGVLGL